MKESSSSAFQSDGSATEPRVFELSVSTSSHETIVEKLLHFRISAGDAVSDEQFTHIAGRFFPPQKEGFSFACFSDGCAVLNVPAQSFDDWYPAGEWISSAKEEIATKIAERFDLCLCEPPDRRDYILPPPSTHHHLELISRGESIVVAHPLYLKIRMFSKGNEKIVWGRHEKLPDPGKIFQELTRLYVDDPAKTLAAR